MRLFLKRVSYTLAKYWLISELGFGPHSAQVVPNVLGYYHSWRVLYVQWNCIDIYYHDNLQYEKEFPRIG